jgi:hypothetical protein
VTMPQYGKGHMKILRTPSTIDIASKVPPHKCFFWYYN